MHVTMKFKLNWAVCRVCLKEGEELSTIFAKDENEILIADKIMECGGITITNDSNLPQEICKKCSAFLSVAYKFRVTCKNSDEVLRSFTEKKDEQIEEFKDDETKDDHHRTEETFQDESHTETVSVFVDPTGQFLDNVYTNADDDLDRDDDYEDDDDNDSTYEPPKNLEKSYEVALSEDEEEDTKPIKELLDDSMEDATPRRRRGRPKKSDPPREKTTRGKKPKPRGPRKQKESSKTLAIDSDGTPVIKYRNLNEKPQHICDVCGNVYKMRYSLDNHMRWHRKEKPYDCEICGAAFGLNSQLTRHMRTHTGQKPYECQYCGRRFSDLGTKNKHERTHTGERPYKCETCGKTFTYSHVLSAHKLTHTGEKRYSCDECGKRFTRAHHLKAHLSTLIHQKPSADRQTASTSQSASLSSVQITMQPPIIAEHVPVTSTPIIVTSSGAEAMAAVAVATNVIADEPDIKVQILPSGQILSNSNDSHTSNPGNNMERSHPMPLFLF